MSTEITVNNPKVKSLQKTLNQIKKLILSDEWDNENPNHKALWSKMVDGAIELHHLVSPKHHKHMIKNRGVDPDHPKFYDHIHPVEDLLYYIKDPHANDDPEDVTIDKKFSFRVYSRRWGHRDTYYFTRTKEGWYLECMGYKGDCDKYGNPILFTSLNHDSIRYPSVLDSYLYYLWMAANEDGLTEEQVQNALNELADWVSLCEESSPRGVWEGYI